MTFSDYHHFGIRECTNLGPVLCEGLNPFWIGNKLLDFQIFVPDFFNPVVEGSHF